MKEADMDGDGLINYNGQLVLVCFGGSGVDG